VSETDRLIAQAEELLSKLRWMLKSPAWIGCTDSPDRWDDLGYLMDRSISHNPKVFGL